MMARVFAPRGVFLNFPLGRQCGKPNVIALQTSILKDTLAVLSTADQPGEIVELSYEWHEPFEWSDYSKDIQAMLEEEGAPLQDWKPKD
jgi:hypothetical protein